MQSQFTMTEDKTVILVDVPAVQCVHNRFNTRKGRDKTVIERLAERITRNGFERTRALWAVEHNDLYEVFAGGTRLEAARLAGIDIVPVMLHRGFTDEDISRRADEDNENDEYHLPVSPVDMWAEYARLRDEEGWTQDRIARAKAVAQSRVSERIKWHGLTAEVKGFIQQSLLDEGHLREITSLSIVGRLGVWLTTEQAWEELATKAVRDKGKNGDKSVRAVRQDVDQWKEFITYAERVHGALLESATLYNLSGAEPKPFEYNAKTAFVTGLANRKARSLVKVKAAEQEIRSYIADNLAAYQRHIQSQSAEAAREAEKAQNEQRLLAKFAHGDCVEMLENWQGGQIRLLLTDPPYGMEYQSNRRWKSKPPDRIQGDGKSEAMDLLTAAILAAVSHLADNSHVLVFCNWENEPEVRRVLMQSGLRVKGSLIWVKEEHSAGDVKGAFAPRHERIVHAVKGSPEVTPRIPDVLEVSRSRESSHPTEKPVELLRRLIESTTAEGDLVIDPFAGCASTLVAALRAKREFWGAEVDDNYHDEGCARLLKEAERNGV